VHPTPVRDFKKGGADLGKAELPSRQDAFLTGLTMTLLKQSPAIYAYLRDSEVGEDGCFLIFYKLPAEVLCNISQAINVEDQKAWVFQQSGVLFTAIQLKPSDEEMEELSGYYHDEADKKETDEIEDPKIEGPEDQAGP
jgi:hypothetical protein